MEHSPSSDNPIVLLNPAANRGKMDQYRALLHRRLDAEPQAEYVETTRQGEAKELAMIAAKEGRSVIIVGGDGSVHEAVNGILSSGMRVPLGIVAAGTGNDFAWNTLKLPRVPIDAIEKAFNGQLIAVTNGPTYGAGFRINPKANHADGLFDVCTIDYAPLRRALKLLPVVKKGEHIGLPEVTCYLAKSVSIESQHCVNVQMDGETSNSNSYSVENLPAALLLRV